MRRASTACFLAMAAAFAVWTAATPALADAGAVLIDTWQEVTGADQGPFVSDEAEEDRALLRDITEPFMIVVGVLGVLLTFLLVRALRASGRSDRRSQPHGTRESRDPVP